MMRITELNKLKPLGTSIETLTHRFLQKHSVSGTAKGKGKVKDGQTLKRSKITIKKGQQQKPDPSATKGPRKGQLEELIDKCLQAKAPSRYRKPKEIEREAEREKMGLISEERKQEIANFKKKSKNKTVDENENKSYRIGTEGLDLIALGVVDGDKVPKYELTVEDGRKLAKEYSRVLMRKHRERQAAETGLLKCKKEAIEALPESLREAALVPDLTPFPVNRFMATLTPPIEGYIEKVSEAAARRKGSVKAKLR